ncbi:hypothetical protein KGY79_13525 [Candidatus Bipolaricaulota bacterium]|nr:hypothetical protein [Candidatus Bipolaricaulota bacterium]
MKKEIWKQLLIGFIPLFILAFGGSYMGVYTATKVDRVKIHNIEQKDCEQDESIKELRKADKEIWRYLIERYEGENRGESVNIPMSNV